jgi:hypothetical protein
MQPIRDFALFFVKIKNSPLVNATVEGVVLQPSAFSMTLAALPSMTATHEFVVPRSIPITAPLILSELRKIAILNQHTIEPLFKS